MDDPKRMDPKNVFEGELHPIPPSMYDINFIPIDDVWYIIFVKLYVIPYLHLVDFYGKCRQTYHTWNLWNIYLFNLSPPAVWVASHTPPTNEAEQIWPAGKMLWKIGLMEKILKLMDNIRNLVEGSNPSLVGPAISFFCQGLMIYVSKWCDSCPMLMGKKQKTFYTKKTCNLCNVFDMRCPKFNWNVPRLSYPSTSNTVI